MLSILHREMRVVSRRKRTVWSRVITTAIGFAFCLILMFLGKPGSGGSWVFSALTLGCFWFALIEGVRRAAGAIADEKRDGTLGLLFLTDLRPRHIIGGKLAAVAIPILHPFLAFLPVLSISVLLGGITGAEVIRAALVLGSVLIYSISAGLFISSVSRRARETGSSLIFLLLAGVWLPIVFSFFSWIGPLRKIRWLSPWTAFSTISDPGYRVSAEDFWIPLLITNAISILLLCAAAFFLPRRWEDRPVLAGAKPARLNKSRFSPQRRAAILDRNPGEWLAVRHSMGSLERWIFTIAMLIVALLAAVFSSSYAGGRQEVAFGLLSTGAFLVMIRLASQASYPLAEARRSGAIEMLISTPMNPKCLIDGQMIALRNQFLPLLGLLLVSSIISLGYDKGAFHVIGSLAGLLLFWGPVVLLSCTVAAFGMWMGLREKSPNAAFFKTIVFTLILPIPVSCLGMGCSWFVLPIVYIVLLIVSAAQLTGRDLERLLRKERR